MKKIFTLLAFLVVTANAAAQTPLNVSNPSGGNLRTSQQIKGNRGVVENNRLCVCGYVFPSYKAWGWIDGSTDISNTEALSADVEKQRYGWVQTDIFKGVDYFFSTQSKYSAYNNASVNQNCIFYITNCSGIDVFLYHDTTNSGVFSITATPVGESNSLSASKTLSAVGTYFPSLYGLDRSKTYQIVLSIPVSTYFHEISFLSRDLRTYQTTVTDGVNWGTMYLDFPVTIPTDHPKLQVLAVSSADETNGCSVFPITGSIPKNTGVLLYEPDVPTHKTITFTETGEPDPVISMLAGTAETDFTVAKALQGKSQTTKVLTLGREKNNPDLVGFFIYNGTTLSQYKAYLTYDYGTPTSGSNVKGFYISGFDELTGVQTLEIENTEPGNWYSLQGVRLNARPTQRGIYLNNGKKVFVK